ncbi:MAG: hypothetical protein IJA26_08455 [Clostridia bacterium]|nr:hypothetical protein [Clostridia bacterium]
MEEKIASAQDAALSEERANEKAPASMAWHKFQKNFLLWLIALLYLLRAFLIASGNIYYEATIRDAVYRGMPLLRALDYLFAAHCTAAGVLGVISAIRLNKGRTGLLLRLHIIMAAAEAAYVLLRWAVSELPPLNIQCAALLIAHVLLWRVNKIYYSRRNDLSGKAEK